MYRVILIDVYVHTESNGMWKLGDKLVNKARKQWRHDICHAYQGLAPAELVNLLLASLWQTHANYSAAFISILRAGLVFH